MSPLAAQLDGEEAKPHRVYDAPLHHVVHTAEIVHHLGDILCDLQLF